MKIYVLVFEGFALFETNLIGFIARPKHEVVTVGITHQAVTSMEGFQITPHTTIGEVDVDQVDLFVIPGGNTPSVLGNESIVHLMKALGQKEKLIGAICHGPVLLAEAGLLADKKYTSNVTKEESSYALFIEENFQDTDVVKDGNIITAKGNAYVEFAMEACKTLGIFENESSEQWYRAFLKNSNN